MLLQGGINAFVMFFARIIARVVTSQVRDELVGIVYFATMLILQIVFGILASRITSAFSRYREYRADGPFLEFSMKVFYGYRLQLTIVIILAFVFRFLHYSLQSAFSLVDQVVELHKLEGYR